MYNKMAEITLKFFISFLTTVMVFNLVLDM